MSDIPDNVMHWLLAASIPLIGSLFLFLIKRTFSDFEKKIEDVFGKLEKAVDNSNNQNIKLEKLDTRVEAIERQINGSRRRR